MSIIFKTTSLRTLLIFSWVYLTSYTNADETNTSKSNSILASPVTSSITLAAFDDLSELIRSDRSTLSKDFRLKAIELIAELDHDHRKLFRQTGLALIEATNVNEMVMMQTKGLPTRLPIPERAILCAIHMQIEMLDALFYLQAPALAERMRAGRLTRSVINPANAIFYDSRDQVIMVFIENMNLLHELQAALGIQGELKIHFPSHITSMSQVERYFEVVLTGLLSRTKSLLGHSE